MRKYYLTRQLAVALFAYFTNDYKDVSVRDMEWANNFMRSENLKYSNIDRFSDFIARNNIEILEYENDTKDKDEIMKIYEKLYKKIDEIQDLARFNYSSLNSGKALIEITNLCNDFKKLIKDEFVDINK